MTFAQLNLDSRIFKAIDMCGYQQPTPIQAQCIPDILEGKDLVASAQTGTGKTAAFVLPALQRLSAQPSTNKARVLILTPTRELASQITQAAGKYGQFLRFNVVDVVGGMPYRDQIRKLSRQVDIIVATPGRLIDHMENKRVDLSGIEMLVLDEADRMLDMGFIEEVEKIARSTPKHRQTLLFSATMDKKVADVVRHLLKNPIRVDLSQEKMAPAKITQKVLLADNIAHKKRLLLHLLQNNQFYKAIIFSATKMNADKLAQELCHSGLNAAALHGDLNQNKRNRTVDQLRRGKIQFLVATDVAARGMDVADISHVINFDLPKFCEDYVHRIGRTGRAGKSGVAISMALPADSRHLQRIERYIGKKLEHEVIEGLEPSKQARQDDFPKTKKAFRKDSARKDGFSRKKDSFRKRDAARFDDFPKKKKSFHKQDDVRHDEFPRKKKSFYEQDDVRHDEFPRKKKSFHREDDVRHDDFPRKKKSFHREDDVRQDEFPRKKKSFHRQDDVRHDEFPRKKKSFHREDDVRQDEFPRKKKSFHREDDVRQDEFPRKKKSFHREDDVRQDEFPRKKKSFHREDNVRQDEFPRKKKSFHREDNVRQDEFPRKRKLVYRKDDVKQDEFPRKKKSFHKQDSARQDDYFPRKKKAFGKQDAVREEGSFKKKKSFGKKDSWKKDSFFSKGKKRAKRFDS